MTTESTENMYKSDREKYWDEVDTDEQVERMHQVVKSVLQAVKDLQNRMRLLELHQHGNDGGLLVAYNDNHWRSEIDCVNLQPEKDVYF